MGGLLKNDDVYEPFYEALELMVEQEHKPDTWNDLRNMMYGYGFRRGKPEDKIPSKRQIDHAWKHLKERSLLDTTGWSARVHGQRRIEGYSPPSRYRVQIDGLGRRHKIANRSFVYRGKRYRKGQYLGKEFRE